MLTLLLLAAAAAPGDGKTMAMDDWHALAITSVGGEANGPVYLRVHGGDLDGDGKADDAVLKIVCGDEKVTEASYVISPRDSASGMATGRRKYAPVRIVKWTPVSDELQKIRPQYDIKTLKGNERLADGWTKVTLTKTEGLCPAAQASIVKSKSNITNNRGSAAAAAVRSDDRGEVVLKPLVAFARATLEPLAVADVDHAPPG